MRVVVDGSLPIYVAALCSYLDVLKYLHKAYLESISTSDSNGRNLLHIAALDDTSDLVEVKAKVQYLCDHCPALILLRDNEFNTSIFYLLTNVRFDYKCAQILCNVNESVVKVEYTTPGEDFVLVPLHHFIDYQCSSDTPEVSPKGDCFRLLLST